MPKPFPMKIKPITSRIMLAIKVNWDAESFVKALTMVEKPVIPPKAKLLGNLKK